MRIQTLPARNHLLARLKHEKHDRPRLHSGQCLTSSSVQTPNDLIALRAVGDRAGSRNIIRTPTQYNSPRESPKSHTLLARVHELNPADLVPDADHWLEGLRLCQPLETRLCVPDLGTAPERELSILRDHQFKVSKEAFS